MPAQTLYQLAGVTLTPPALADATLILIDYQNEYLSGPLTLVGAEPAVERAGALLAAARQAGARIIHVAHRGAVGGPFDRTAERGAIIPSLAPLPGEPVVEKTMASSFAGTNLDDLLGSSGQKLVIVGFMTHNCVSSTVRATMERGHGVTIAADACATRDLPGPDGQDIPADLIHRATLAALADRHALVTNTAALIG